MYTWESITCASGACSVSVLFLFCLVGFGGLVSVLTGLRGNNILGEIHFTSL